MEGGEKVMDDFLNSLNELQNDLQEKANKVESLQGTHEVTFEELFTNELMQSKTHFKDIEFFLKSLGVKSNEEFNNLPQEELNAFVNKNTDFSNWNEMLQYAKIDYINRKTGMNFN